MNLGAILALYFAVSVQADVLRDWAIVAKDSNTLGDCAWSLLNEKALSAGAITKATPFTPLAICHKQGGGHCDKTLTGWERSMCVGRYQITYRDGQAPDLTKSWRNNKGACFYYPWGNDAGGFTNGYDNCPCGVVGQDGGGCR